MSIKKIYDEINRRNLMKYVGNMALFAPFIRTLSETQAFGDDGAPKRAIFFYYPDGIIPEKFHPAAGPLSGMNEMTAPLARVKDNIIILRDTNYRTSMSHEGGMNYCLTGSPDRKPAVSIDTVLGQKFKGPLFEVLRLGIASHWEGGQDAQSCSYLKPGQLAVREDNPAKAFQTLFGGAAPTPSPSPMPGGAPMPAPQPTSGLLGSSKVSLLDSNIEQLKSLQGKLAAVEKVKLDSHVEAVRELERRIKATMGPAPGMNPPAGGGGGGGQSSGPSAQCTRTFNEKMKFDVNDSGYPKKVWLPASIDAVIDMQTELAVQALACRLTNIVLLQVGHSVWELPFGGGSPGSGRGHHSTSHYDAEGNVAEHVKGQAYMMNKFANLVDMLGKVKEGDKTLLYNSVSMAFSEFGDSAKHAFSNVGTVLAGQQGGYFKTGRCVSGGGASHNQTLVSLLQSFGLSDNTFGQADLGSGPIAALRG